MHVVQVMRRPQGQHNFSIEGLFDTVRAHLPSGIDVTTAIAPHASFGIRRRIQNALWARAWRDEVVHVTGDILYVTPALGRRAIITFHDIGWVKHRGVARAAFEWLWCALPARSARIVTTVSEFTRSQLLRLVPDCAGKTRVIHNCYNPAFRRAAPRDTGEVPVVLCVGTTANKNLERFSAAIEGMKCTLHIVGPLSQSQSKALRDHRVSWKNSINIDLKTLVAAYNEADIVALPSTYEGFGLPIIEAQAVGRPVLTSATASMPEVAGAAALMVDPFDLASIRKGMLRLLESDQLRSELRERGFENVRRFEAARVAAEYAAAYRDAAAMVA